MADSPVRTENQKRAETSGANGPVASDSPSIVICLGASAGGLEALEAFFSEMPPDLSAQQLRAGYTAATPIVGRG